jgi:hypothetical protein
MQRLMKTKLVIPGRPLAVPAAPQAFARRSDGLYFYQACDLPGIGFVPGAWDHRGGEDAYLGHTEFDGLTAIDVGPANGFWSFEMERRGANVTAIELGEDDLWDAVPHVVNGQKHLQAALKDSVRSVHSDFLRCRTALKSNVGIKRGSAYSIPDLVGDVDVALMGNILQHLRDPFLAIERVASRVKKRIVISEAFWIDDEALLHSARLSLIPRRSTPTINHSWYQTTPVFVSEVLDILGFENIRHEMHWQAFHGTDPLVAPRMIRHFTVVADRSPLTTG